MKVIVCDKILAQSDKTVSLEGNYYFPPDAVSMEYLKKTDHQYTCPWKGECDYYDVVVGECVEKDAAWMYPEPSEAAQSIKGFFAFKPGIKIQE